MSATNPALMYIETFTITGPSVRTRNSDEMNPQTAKIPGLWQRFHTSELAKEPCPKYGVYSHYETDVNGWYTVTAGVKSSNGHGVIVPAGNYLVFTKKGTMPQAVIDAWTEVWNYFSTENKEQRSYLGDFELYSGPEEVSVYIGIK